MPGNTSILILGNGARENVIREKLTDTGVTPFLLNTPDFDEVVSFIIKNDIQVVFPGTESYLCNGIKDYLEIHTPNVKVFGPDRYQSQLEGSKIFSKILMNKLKIPTAPFYYVKTPAHFWCDDPLDDIVVKYCGLANGKGVYLPKQTESIKEILTDLEKFGKDGFIIENRYRGTEVSVMAFCNGTETFLMPCAQDYKNIYDGNLGPNTGGMGSICPVHTLSREELNIVKKHMDSVVRELKYVGILYAGIMKTRDGLFFLEFNCRFGDPETQSILNLLETKLLDIINICLSGEKLNIEWNDFHSATVVLSHTDYPESRLATPIQMSWTEQIDNNVKTYHSNVTTDSSGNCYTTGGRVLSLTSVDMTREAALRNIYSNIDKIQYDGVYYRKDIGTIFYNVIDE